MHAAREAFVSHRNAGTAFHGRLLSTTTLGGLPPLAAYD